MTYNDPLETIQAFRDFLFDREEAAPADIRLTIRNLTNDLVALGAFLTSIYQTDRGEGSAETVGPELMKIAAGGLGVFATYQFLEIGRSGDAAKMRMALLRDAGVEAPQGMAWPEASNDPVFARPAEAPTMPPMPPSTPEA